MIPAAGLPAHNQYLRVAGAMFAVGWGANQFAPMLSVYRQVDHLSQPVVTAMFAAYVGGLVPALLAAGWWSQHRGKRPFVRLAVVLSLVASVLLAWGADHLWLLYLGRLVAGAAAGVVMGPGTGWVKELSGDRPAGTGARRATIALSAGFGGGPLVAGVLAQWAPWPQVLPYLVHVVVVAAAGVAVWTAPELDRGDHPTPTVAAVVDVLRTRWFTRRVMPTAPWVFGVATTGFVILPAAVREVTGEYGVLAIALSAGLVLGTGVLVQPRVRAFEDAHPGRTLPTAMTITALGLLLGIVTTWTQWLWLLPVCTIVLGTSYGMTLVGGLRTIETHVPVHLLAPVSAVYYCLTYLGFFIPLVAALVSTVVSVPVALAFGLVSALLVVPVVLSEPGHGSGLSSDVSGAA